MSQTPQTPQTLSSIAPDGQILSRDQVRSLVGQACAGANYSGRKVIVIVPDATRSCPLGMVFEALFDEIGSQVAAIDVMIALGTHPPMSEEAICERLEMNLETRRSKFSAVKFLNHDWNNPAALRHIGKLTREETAELTGGLLEMEVPVEINAALYNYDEIIIIGPVFPHEVVGFSGGNKYLFPGVSGPEVLHFFHWLGAVVTNPMIIGNKWTPVRKVVDRAAGLVEIPKRCFCMVVEKAGLAGLFSGDPVSAWDQASELSRKLHIEYKDHPFHTVLSCAPKMYDELWVGGKCMYKLEPVVADGGELIIYAPHIHEISITHGEMIRAIGYHCRDYFLKQWDKFKDMPWGTLAHSTHIRGIGTFENGVEHCRVNVTLATSIPENICKEINLGYRDWRSINAEDFANKEDQGILHVPKAGEKLYHLRQRPEWAREM